MKTAIIGTGGHAREMLDLLLAQRRAATPVGFLDEDPRVWGTSVRSLPVLGGIDWLSEQSPSELELVCAVGKPAARRRLAALASALGFRFATLVHPTAVLGARVELGLGVLVTAGSILTDHVVLHAHVHLNLQTTVSHDGDLGAYSLCAPGVHLAGNVTVGEGAEIGIGASVIQGLTVGAWAIVGAGATVIRDVPPDTTVVGVPARVIATRAPGWQDAQPRAAPASNQA